MSGFALIFNRDGRPVASEAIENMIRVMTHRGPDTQSVHVDGALGLGHGLLKTGAGSQLEQMPADGEKGGVWLSGDLRLDDRKELWRKLGFDTLFDPLTPDSQLVLHAYAKWGDRCPCYLMGDFAFVLWDLSKRKILAARDPFGVKPFYYHLSDKMFVAGSEMKAIKTVQDIGFELNEDSLLDYLVVIFPGLESTIYKRISKLPPASCLSVTPFKSELYKYWELDPSNDLHYKKEEEYIERFREIFFKAVERRLDCYYPVGSYLSGGLDSSSIVSASRKILGERRDTQLHTFSAVFPDTAKSDESSYIRAVLENGNLTPHLFNNIENGPLAVFNDIFNYLDEPRWGYNTYLIWTLLKTAQSQGIRVILDGFDGDTTLSHGDGLFSEWAYTGHWLRLFREMRSYCKIRNKPFVREYVNCIKYFCLRQRLPQMAIRLINVFRKGSNTVSHGSSDDFMFLKDDFLHRLSFEEKYRNFCQQELMLTHRQHHVKKMNSSILPYYLEMSDVISFANGIEPRYPFFDRELVEFCIALPWNLKLRNGLSRVIMREAMAGVLPDIVRNRTTKGDLSYGFNGSLARNDRNLILEGLQSMPFNFFNAIELERLREKFQNSKTTNYDEMLIWRLLILKLWYNKVY